MNIHARGNLLSDALRQMENAIEGDDRVVGAALMADHHVGYSVPIGGVIAYRGAVSPSGVGYDIGCGNTFYLFDQKVADYTPDQLNAAYSQIYSRISFGVGRKNDFVLNTDFIDSINWNSHPLLLELKDLAASQLGTVGSGNHYVDIFNANNHLSVGVHFGSRGFGHKIATHFIKAGGGTDGMNVKPVVLDENSDLGEQYIHCMQIAGEYARAGRQMVCETVANIFGASVKTIVDNNHNLAWKENHNNEDVWVVRKGATPLNRMQLSFIGATMAEPSAIVTSTQNSPETFNSTVHGAGRVLSRTAAAGKSKWIKGVKTRISSGLISTDDMMNDVNKANVQLFGAGVDEAPACYKRLDEVLDYHSDYVQIVMQLSPMAVFMAGANEFDPYKD